MFILLLSLQFRQGTTHFCSTQFQMWQLEDRDLESSEDCLPLGPEWLLAAGWDGSWDRSWDCQQNTSPGLFMWLGLPYHMVHPHRERAEVEAVLLFMTQALKSHSVTVTSFY